MEFFLAPFLSGDKDKKDRRVLRGICKSDISGEGQPGRECGGGGFAGEKGSHSCLILREMVSLVWFSLGF